MAAMKTGLGRFLGIEESRAPVLDRTPPHSPTTEHGSARFLMGRQLANTELSGIRKTTFAEIQSGALVGKGGIYVGSDGEDVYYVTEDRHVMLLAPTRSGKTRKMLMQQIIMLAYSGESLFVFDPKFEICGCLAELLRSLGYEVVRIDLRDPRKSNFWNALHYAIEAYRGFEGITKEFKKLNDEDPDSAECAAAEMKMFEAVERAEDEVNKLVSIIYPRNGQKEDESASFFASGCEDVLRLVLHYVCSRDKCPEPAMVMRTAYRLLSSHFSPIPLDPKKAGKNDIKFVPVWEQIERFPMEHPCYKLMKDLEPAGEYVRDFVRNAKNKLQAFSYSELAYMMQGTDVLIEEAATKKVATFCIIPEGEKTRAALASLYIDQTYSKLKEKAEREGNRLPVRMNIVCEELKQLPPIEDLDNRLSFSGGLGIRWILVVQDLTQLEDQYGKTKAPTIISNCGVRVFLGTNHVDTAKWYSEELGSYTAITESRSSSKDSAALVSKTRTDSTRSVERKLLRSDEVQSWDPAVDGAIVSLQFHEHSVVPAPDISLTPMNEWAGMGDEEHNKRKIAAERDRTDHPVMTRLVDWAPELNPGKRHTDDERKAAHEKWVAKMRRMYYSRNGMEPPEEKEKRMAEKRARAS